jgi:hypothetical protein
VRSLVFWFRRANNSPEWLWKTCHW